ncbi:MAG: hydroxyacid dehydrogenase [Alphaproteobacteria bacterium]|nr:hydroxyacid dehydrogenase [Alphaproteobacteria bacterium]
MSGNTKIVVRFDNFINPAFQARLSEEPDIEYVELSQQDEPKGWEAFARAHVYHISAAKDETAKHWWATAPLLERSPNLLAVSSSGAGYDTTDAEACTKAGVLVVNQAGGNAQSVAEHTLALMLDLSKRVSETDRLLRTERGYPREALMGREISGRTLGLIGIGQVGSRVAKLANAFNMTVIATDPNVDAETMAMHGARKVELDELLAQSDFVSIHCPRIPSTTNMINEAAFGAMKPGVIFITTARGGIHDETALAAAMDFGHVAGAGLDVWEIEPPPLDHPLLHRDNVVSTYHTAGVTSEARQRVAQYASDQIVALLKGERPPRIVNPEAWPAYMKRFERILGRTPG